MMNRGDEKVGELKLLTPRVFVAPLKIHHISWSEEYLDWLKTSICCTTAITSWFMIRNILRYLLHHCNDIMIHDKFSNSCYTTAHDHIMIMWCGYHDQRNTQHLLAQCSSSFAKNQRRNIFTFSKSENSCCLLRVSR